MYLQGMGVDRKDFNSFGSRRGNDRVMTRGTFANVRIKNLKMCIRDRDMEAQGYGKYLPQLRREAADRKSGEK